MGASGMGIGMNGTSMECWDLEIGQAAQGSGTFIYLLIFILVALLR